MSNHEMRKMLDWMRVSTWFILAVFCSVEAHAQQLYKCRDAGGRITYSNVSCEKQDLKDAGEIRERSTVLPMAPKAGAAQGERAQRKGDGEDEVIRSPAQVKPVNPIIERLVK